MKINEQTIRQACQTLADTLVAKNKDYGNSVEEQFNEYGLTSLNIRLDDKRRRMKQLTKNPAQVKTESMAETLFDEGGYAVLGYILLSSEDETPLDKYSNQIINLRTSVIESMGVPSSVIGPFVESTEQYLKNKEYLAQQKYSDQDDQY